MKEWNSEAVKIVIESIKKEIKRLENFNCYHCKDFPMNMNPDNETCKKCKISRQYQILQCNERLTLWKNRLIE